METWMKISLILCLFGFLKEIRPSEPFVYEFLIGSWRNLTATDITQSVYPVGTYGYLVQLIIVFLITDICRYKPVIIVCGLSGIVVWAMLLWTKSLLDLQILEVFYGTFMASEVAYYTYIYAKVDKEYFPLVTSHTRASILAGRALSGILAQVLVSFKIMDYRQLNYITFAALIAATVWSLLLPKVDHSLYFHRTLVGQDNPTILKKMKNAFSLMKSQFVESYSNSSVVKWSLWYALGTCGFLQVQCYMQPLWTAIMSDSKATIYNGAVEAVLTVIGFLGALAAGRLEIDKEYLRDIFICSGTLFQAIVIFIGATTHHVYVSYVTYVIYGALYHFLITYISAEIAKHLKEDSFGLIFGFNMFIGMIAQTVLTFIVVTDIFGLELNIREQYFCYGAFHLVLAVMFVITRTVSCLRSKNA